MDELLTLSTVFGQKAIELAASEKDYKATLVHEMGCVLSWLLPLTKMGKIQRGLTEVMNQAVTFKNELAAERTLSTFFWYDVGAEVDVSRVEARDPRRKDLFCVFPGISGERLLLDTPGTVTMVKATMAALGT